MWKTSSVKAHKVWTLKVLWYVDNMWRESVAHNLWESQHFFHRICV